MADYPIMKRRLDEAVAAAVEPLELELARLRNEVHQQRAVILSCREKEIRAATVIALAVPSFAPSNQEPMADIARGLCWPWSAASA
jgi:hypothetical protein